MAAARAAGIDALLPQTQCRACGYGGCAPYAAAVAVGAAAIDRCAPGGTELVATLAGHLGLPRPPLGEPLSKPALRTARIDETACIGCTLCIQACPVDAIVGAAKHMHTVLETRCTGCQLCVPPCPVDCIDMVSPRAELAEWTPARALLARGQYEARARRLAAAAAPAARASKPRRQEDRRGDPSSAVSSAGREQRQAVVRAAIAAAAARRARHGDASAGDGGKGAGVEAE